MSRTARAPRFVALLVVFVTTSLLGCPTLAAADSAADLKSVVGKWVGQGRSPQGTNPLEWTINDDGSVNVVTSTPNGTVTGVAKMSTKDGKLFYESGTSSGTVIVQDDNRRLRYEGLSKRGNFPVGADMTRAK
jgi:hypothetical protein